MAIGIRAGTGSTSGTGSLTLRWKTWRRLALLIFALLLTITAGLRWGYRMEEQLGLPMLFIWRGEVAPPPGAVIVRIDDPSLDAFRDLPKDQADWPEPLARCATELGGLEGILDPLNETDLPRGIYACAIDILHAHGVAGIQLDVVFPQNAGRLSGTDALLKALERSTHVSLFGMADMARRREDQQIVVKRNDPAIEELGFGMGSWALTKGDAYNMIFWSRRHDFDMPLQLPLSAALTRIAKELEPSLRSAGIDCSGDPGDGDEQSIAVGKGFADLLKCLEGGAHLLADISSSERERINRILALSRNNNALFFNFFGPPSTLPSISIAQLTGLVEWPRDLPSLENSVAFIGHQNLDYPTTQDDLNTVFAHPNGLGMSGVESAATAYLNVWYDTHIRPLPEPLRLAVGLLALLAIAFAGSRGRPLYGMALASGVALGYVLLCLVAFSHMHLWLPWMPAIAAWPFALVMAATGGYGRASRLVERLAGDAIASQLLEHDGGAELGERELAGTVLYCDLEGYSAMAKERGMVAAARLIKSMFEGMEVNILAEGGHIHQITGDGIIACWFEDPKRPSDADRACRAALATWPVMDEVNADLMREYGISMRMRIGLNAGPLLVTGMGRQKLHIAVVGETINKGQRIEQLVKTAGHFDGSVAILLDQTVVDRLSTGHNFNLIHAGRFTLAKSDQTTEITQLLR